MKRLFTVLAAAIMTAGVAFAQDVETFNQAVETFNNGAMALQNDNKAEALSMFKQALTIFEGCGEEGAEMVAKCKELIPSTVISIAKDFINDKEFDKALECIDEAKKVAAEYGNEEAATEAAELVSTALNRKGASLVMAKDFANAIPVLQQVVEAEPENGQAFLLLGQSLLQIGKTDEAIAALKTAAANGKDQANKLIGSTYLKQGQAAVKAKKYAEAIEAIEEANKYIDNAQAYKLLAAANSGSGKTAAAITAYKKYLELDPKAKDANKVMLTIAATAQKAGDKATAVEYYTKLQNDAEFGATAKAQLAALKK